MTSDNSEQEPVTFVDKRKIDPETGGHGSGAGREPLAGTAADSADTGVVDEAEALAGRRRRRADELAERTADLQRLQAEYTNYRRRVERDKQADIANAKASVVGELVAVLDDLDRARSHGDLESGPLRVVADKLTATLTALGLSEFGAEGDAFDPDAARGSAARG